MDKKAAFEKWYREQMGFGYLYGRKLQQMVDFVDEDKLKSILWDAWQEAWEKGRDEGSASCEG